MINTNNCPSFLRDPNFKHYEEPDGQKLRSLKEKCELVSQQLYTVMTDFFELKTCSDFIITKY